MDYEAVIGMEVHAQVLTASKMFCGCSADYAGGAAQHAHLPGVPGHARRVAGDQSGAPWRPRCSPAWRWTARSRRSASSTARTIPIPTCPRATRSRSTICPCACNGELDIDADGGRRDASAFAACTWKRTPPSSIHAGGSSLIDFNRAGVPLMEIVTEADIRTAEEAWPYLTKLRTILRYLGVSSGNMEEGAMRCEANISLRPVGAGRLRHQGRGQEPQLVPRGAPGHRLRDRAPDAHRWTRAGASSR